LKFKAPIDETGLAKTSAAAPVFSGKGVDLSGYAG
jgi:hypothetical protein